MKTMKFALLTMCSMFIMSSAWAGSYVIEDDIYYNPDEKNPVVAQKEEEAKQKAAQKTLVVTADNTLRDVDEYNRRGSSAPETSLNDLVANQTDETVTYNIVDENGSDGYYLNGFNGSQSDYEYATRIRRFHNPKFVISISDPYYSDIYFLDNSDWNVYIDNNYAWVTPTWTNPWYWNYTWSPVSYTSWSWRWNFGPFGFSVGYRPYTPYYAWGANWGWNSWYHPYYHHHYYDYPYYGWHNPYRPAKPNYQYTPNGRTPNRNGGSYISSGGTTTTGNGRRSVIGNSSSTSGKNTTISNGRRSTTSVSSGEGTTGVRTNRGTIINSNSSNTGRGNGYHFESTTSGSRRSSSSQSETIKTPSNNSGRQTTIGTNGRSSNRSNSYNSGSSNRSNSYNSGRTTTPNRSSGYSSGSSVGRRPAGSSYSSPSRGSSSSSSGSSSRGSGSSGRSSGRR